MTSKPQIDWQAAMDGSRPVTTRDGLKVVLYCVDAPGQYPVHGRIEGAHLSSSWGVRGNVQPGSHPHNNLIQLPRRFKYERWVNVYKDESFSGYHTTKEEALGNAYPSCIACVKVIIEGEEGEGLG